MELKRKKNIAVGVLMGGPSAEHVVSLASGENVLAYLDKSKYKLLSIRISKDGQWFLNNRKVDFRNALKRIDIAFLALHGEFGEDGKIQTLLEYFGVPYTGSSITASVLGMDKSKSRELFKAAGILTPGTLLLEKKGDYDTQALFFVNKIMSFPVVVKPVNRGSSVGVSLVKDNDSLLKGIKKAFKYDSHILIEEYIDGREVTCSVLENFQDLKIAALPPTEIIPKKGNKFFNYTAKYSPGAADEITPAQISNEQTEAVKEAAIKAHKILGCKGYSRSDMICKGNKVYLLELNTLPGLTVNSLIPKQANAAGLDFRELLDIIINNA